MIRLIILITTLAWFSVTQAQDKVEYCSYTFPDTTMPEGFSTYDMDGQAFHYTATQLGFDEGDAWKCLREENVYPYNYFVASHSRHKKVKGEEQQPANDWLVMPSILVRSADAVLTWRSNSICENLETTSTYYIKISTQGNRPENFTDLALATIDNDPINQWTQHSLSLAEYAGQQVYIAIVNTTLDGEMLAIDDLTITGSQGDYLVSTNMDSYVCGQTSFTPTLTLHNLSEKTCNKLLISTTDLATSKTSSQIYTNVNIQPDEMCTITLCDEMQVAYGDTLRLQIKVKAEGVILDDILTQTVFLSFDPRQHIVIEEGTGNWCGWCPKGLYAMQVLKEKYGDTIVPICVHSDDVMEVEGYIGSSGITFPLGFPSGQINRKYESEPLAEVHEGRKSIWTTLHGGFETYVLKELEIKPMAEVQLTATTNGKSITLTSNTTFCVPQQGADLRMAYILIEDTYQKKGLNQKNYLAGNDAYETIGEFSKMGSSLTDYVYEDVARAAAQQAFQGIKNSVPSNVEVDTPYEHKTTMVVPDEVGDINNCSVAALLIDHKTGHIINAQRTKVTNPSGIESTTSASTDSVIYDLQGRRVQHTARGIFIKNGKKIMF